MPQVYLASLLLLICSQSFAQELIQTDFERGYVKDGKKISVWQYFLDSEKQPELVINHSNGKVIFISKDTSDYIVFKNEQWVKSKLDIRPVPVAGTNNFYQSIVDTLKYPSKDFEEGLEGRVVITFEVDTTGATKNYQIIKSLGGSCDSAVIKAFKAVDPKWISARIGSKRFQTKFAMAYEFRLKEYEAPLENEDFLVNADKAKFLDAFVITSGTKNAPYSYVEKSAEFIGGLEAMSKWLGKNLHYPVQARRMGIEGKVTVSFIIEPDGSITNASVVKGFYHDCDKEAVRVVTAMPKWSPAERSGRKVRQHYVFPVTFRLFD